MRALMEKLSKTQRLLVGFVLIVLISWSAKIWDPVLRLIAGALTCLAFLSFVILCVLCKSSDQRKKEQQQAEAEHRRLIAAQRAREVQEKQKSVERVQVRLPEREAGAEEKDIANENKIDCQKRQDQNLAPEYTRLVMLYSDIYKNRKPTVEQTREEMQLCINACEHFDTYAASIAITPELERSFNCQTKKTYTGRSLLDFKNIEVSEKYEFNASTAIARIRDNVNNLKKSEEAFLAFIRILDSLPTVEIEVSDKPAEKRTISELSEINYSNITKKTPRDKLGNFVVFDTETTGLNVSNSEIVEISAIRFRNYEPVEAFTTLCQPRRGISEEAAKINGITAEMVKDKPTFGQVAQAFQNFIGEDNLVAHNLQFDLKFIVKYGVDVMASKRRYYDTLDIAQRTLKRVKDKWDKELGCYMPNYDGDYDVVNYKLATLCSYYGIPLSGAHRALADCFATGLLFQRLAEDRE